MYTYTHYIICIVYIYKFYIRQCNNFISHCWFHVAFFSLSQTPGGPCRGLLLPGMSDTVDQALKHWVWKLFPKFWEKPLGILEVKHRFPGETNHGTSEHCKSKWQCVKTLVPL